MSYFSEHFDIDGPLYLGFQIYINTIKESNICKLNLLQKSLSELGALSCQIGDIQLKPRERIRVVMFSSLSRLMTQP